MAGVNNGVCEKVLPGAGCSNSGASSRSISAFDLSSVPCREVEHAWLVTVAMPVVDPQGPSGTFRRISPEALSLRRQGQGEKIPPALSGNTAKLPHPRRLAFLALLAHIPGGRLAHRLDISPSPGVSAGAHIDRKANLLRQEAFHQATSSCKEQRHQLGTTGRHCAMPNPCRPERSHGPPGPIKTGSA